MYLYMFQGVCSLILEKKVAKINLEWREYYLSTNLIDLKKHFVNKVDMSHRIPIKILKYIFYKLFSQLK
jgi:hypothetical protein